MLRPKRIGGSDVGPEELDIESAHAELGTTELEKIIAEWVARQAKMGMPVQQECVWLWTENGPTLDIKVTPVADVVKFDPSKRRKR